MTPRTRLSVVQEFFFKGARNGWAGGHSGFVLRQEDSIPGMEGWREVTHRDILRFAGYHFADRWGNDPDSGKPSGSMFITHWNLPVWGMWVGGQPYEKEVFSFLKEALIYCYRREEFCGGRGPATYRKDNLLYINKFEGDFSRFNGCERIEYINNNGRNHIAGSHEYWGGSFVYLPR